MLLYNLALFRSGTLPPPSPALRIGENKLHTHPRCVVCRLTADGRSRFGGLSGRQHAEDSSPMAHGFARVPGFHDFV